MDRLSGDFVLFGITVLAGLAGIRGFFSCVGFPGGIFFSCLSLKIYASPFLCVLKHAAELVPALNIPRKVDQPGDRCGLKCLFCHLARLRDRSVSCQGFRCDDEESGDLVFQRHGLHILFDQLFHSPVRIRLRSLFCHSLGSDFCHVLRGSFRAVFRGRLLSRSCASFRRLLRGSLCAVTGRLLRKRFCSAVHRQVRPFSLIQNSSFPAGLGSRNILLSCGGSASHRSGDQ